MPNCTKKKDSYYKCIAIVNMNNIYGKVLFKSKNKKCIINYEFQNLTDGKHGFHIHKYGDLSDGCDSACAHFNPDGNVHGGPHSKIRHAGDLGNVTSKKGIAKGKIVVNNLSCNPKSKYSIVGRMIILHADPDDLGKGGDQESLITGNAGKRIACSVIGLC